VSAAAMVLAAGMSTRIAPLAAERPKPLLEVAGESLLGWNLRLLARYGFEDVWINVHYRAEEIIGAIGNGARYGLRIRYSREPEILGTAGGWKRVAHEHRGAWLLLYGDNLTRLDLRRFERAHRVNTALAALFDAQGHMNTGIHGGHAVIEDDRITGFVEGGAGGSGHLINAGVYMLDSSLAADVGDGFADFGRNVFPRWAASGVLRPYVMEPEAFCLGLDTPEHFAIGERLVAGGAVLL
jgi:mannose-1-phosphate guanylyltransferase